MAMINVSLKVPDGDSCRGCPFVDFECGGIGASYCAIFGKDLGGHLLVAATVAATIKDKSDG